MYTYLIIVFFSGLIPFVCSFDSRVRYYKSWPAIFPAILTTAMLFIVWDIYFTAWGFWGFNEEYLTGLHMSNLPAEKVLFFICIPYACLFIHEVLRYFNINFFKNHCRWVSYILIFICFFIGLVHIDKPYTGLVFVLLGMLIFGIEIWGRPVYMGRFYTTYIFSLFPFCIMNGLLTNGIGQISVHPVVWYNNYAILGVRLMGIPVEDFFYLMLLLLSNVTILEFLRKNHHVKEK
ncbi:MAG: lycopene cyclase domain-containing protein [Candidatus Omnitrophica bacterium]|nr:lycopene cyclase domain-containing protein [Candidatus Omnitrophota bacterium]